MKFYRPRGASYPSVQWNPLKDSALYEFVNGVCETDDPEAIKVLEEYGASKEPISPNVQAAMERYADAIKPPPPPPPKESTVPANEPKVTIQPAPPAQVPAPVVEEKKPAGTSKKLTPTPLNPPKK